MVLLAAALFTFAMAPPLVWAWFIEPRTGYHLTPGASLALVALCRILVGPRVNEPGQSLKRSHTQSWASLMAVWALVVGCWFLYLLGVRL